MCKCQVVAVNRNPNTFAQAKLALVFAQVVVVNVPNYSTDATAELTVGLILPLPKSRDVRVQLVLLGAVIELSVDCLLASEL